MNNSYSEARHFYGRVEENEGALIINISFALSINDKPDAMVALQEIMKQSQLAALKWEFDWVTKSEEEKERLRGIAKNITAFAKKI